MSDKLAIVVAPTGALNSRDHTPFMPYTVEEQADEAKRCEDAGAPIYHVHVRDEAVVLHHGRSRHPVHSRNDRGQVQQRRHHSPLALAGEMRHKGLPVLREGVPHQDGTPLGLLVAEGGRVVGRAGFVQQWLQLQNGFAQLHCRALQGAEEGVVREQIWY